MSPILNIISLCYARLVVLHNLTNSLLATPTTQIIQFQKMVLAE